MTWRNVAVQWITVLVLLAVVAVIHIYWPQWTTIESNSRQSNGRTAGNGTYRAIDGDSFSIGKTEIRLHGIDAPEYRQTCTAPSGKSEPCGKMAREQLSNLIGSSKLVCRTIEQDRYGRQVSVCTAGTVEINREMVRLGWAVAYRRHSQAYVAAEREAKSARRGIWQWQFDMPETHRNRSRSFEGGLGGRFKDE